MISAALDVSMDLASTDSTLIDFDYLAQQTFSDRMLERDLLELFVRQCGALLPVIAGPNPVDERLFAAHTLKGSARADGVANLVIELAPIAKAAQAAAARGRARG